MNEVKRWKGSELYHSTTEWIAASNYDKLQYKLSEALVAVDHAAMMIADREAQITELRKLLERIEWLAMNNITSCGTCASIREWLKR